MGRADQPPVGVAAEEVPAAPEPLLELRTFGAAVATGDGATGAAVAGIASGSGGEVRGADATGRDGGSLCGHRHRMRASTLRLLARPATPAE